MVKVPTDVSGIMGTLGGLEYIIAMVPFILIIIVIGFIGFLVMWKTPAWVFFKSFIRGNPLVAMRRKDGVIEFTSAVYRGGLVKSKYGVQILDEGSASPEKKSGVRVAWGLDDIGITLKPEFIRAIQTIKEQYGFNDYREMEKALDMWRVCKTPGCHFEGVAVADYEEVENKVGKITNKTLVFKGLKCPECEGVEMERKFPELEVPLYKIISSEGINKFFKYNYTPTRNDVIIQREVRSQLAKQKSFPVKWIAIGIMIFLIFIGLAIGLNIMEAQGLIQNPEKLVTLCRTLNPPPPVVIPG